MSFGSLARQWPARLHGVLRPDSTRVAYHGSSRESGDRAGTYVYDVVSGERRFVAAGMIEGWVDEEHMLVS